MSELHGPGPQPNQWPAPFVTHEQLGSVHRQIGALDQGQQSLLSTYNHLRGDMLAGFDRLAQLIAAKSAPPVLPPEQHSTVAEIAAIVGRQKNGGSGFLWACIGALAAVVVMLTLQLGIH